MPIEYLDQGRRAVFMAALGERGHRGRFGLRAHRHFPPFASIGGSRQIEGFHAVARLETLERSRMRGPVCGTEGAFAMSDAADLRDRSW